MRTTLLIDDDVLDIAKAIAEREGKTVGKALTELARRGAQRDVAPTYSRNGYRLMPVAPNAGRATLALVNRLRDEEP